jgi:hypothetical protein
MKGWLALLVPALISLVGIAAAATSSTADFITAPPTSQLGLKMGAGVPTAFIKPPHKPNMIYADNGVIKVGADLNRGGAIAHLSVSGAGASNNVINAHDMGREVQLSFYAGPSFYNPPTAQYPDGACDKLFGPEWPWNPIGAGDIDGNKGEILSLSQNKAEGYVVAVMTLSGLDIQ